MDWTKTRFRKHIEKQLKVELERRGYRHIPKEFRFSRSEGQAGEVTSHLSFQVTSANQPPTRVGIHPSASLRIGSVAKVCEALFGRSANTATIGAHLGAFTPNDSERSEYSFDWNDASGAALDQLVADLDHFDAFAASIHSISDLSADRLARLPELRRCFAGGLGETYKYTTPEVAAVIHHLNGDHARAVVALALSKRLPAEQRAKAAAFIGG